MYGGSRKLGRGGGGGVRTPQVDHKSGSVAGSRQSSGGDGGETSSGRPVSLEKVEETFGLVTRSPLRFAMALRLVPDLVEEINRVEVMGGTARMKFDGNPNNADGNVINVGDKSFKFTWSRETGGLCEIYEECKSGDDGNGLLLESGCAWRKLNVQRVLDESTKRHVKMLSEEAERKNKSRKSIVLEHQNSTLKNQIKEFVAAESNSRRVPSKRKEPPLKKLKSEPSPSRPPKPAYKSGLSTINPSKSRPPSDSQLSSQVEPLDKPALPIRNSILVKGPTSVPDATRAQTVDETNLYKGMPSTVGNKPKQSRHADVKPLDLRNFIISHLMEHHKDGMSLRALEKAVGNAMPKPVQKIHPILKHIATFRPPGRYFLKPEVGSEFFKKPRSDNGSSQEINHQQPSTPEKFSQKSYLDSNITFKNPGNKLEKHAESASVHGHVLEMSENINKPHHPPDHPDEKNVSEKCEDHTGSSSCRGRDGDSASNSSGDNGSDSESHSREGSRSTVGSPSGSSSDSQTDVSSRSKQASDEDVDIMASDDDKKSKNKLLDSEPVLASLTLLRSLESENVDIGNHKKQDKRVYDVIDFEKDYLEDGHAAEHISRKCKMTGMNKSGQHSNAYVWPSSKDSNASTAYRSLIINGQDGILLQKEFSDLEFGEFREQLRYEIPSQKKQFEMKGNLRHLKHKPSESGSLNIGKPSTKMSADSGTLSPKNNVALVSGISDRPSRQKPEDNYANDYSPLHRRETPPLTQQHQSSMDNFQHSEIPEESRKFRYFEDETGQGTSLKANGCREVLVNDTQQHNGPTKSVISPMMNESNNLELHATTGSNDRQKDASLIGSNGGYQRKGFSENRKSSSFTKYEKDEPELKGPIKDISQYKEYVKEYQEKHVIYCSLYKILESYRNEFSKLGKDLEAFRGRDSARYHYILGQIQSSFQQYGERHKQLKKIFIVLHEEMKHLKQLIKDYAASCAKG